MSILEFPREILELISGWLTPVEHFVMNHTCGVFRELMHQNSICLRLAIEETLSHGHLEILQWMRDEGYNPRTGDYKKAYNHLRICKWLSSNGILPGCEIIDIAAIAGNIDVLQWAHKKLGVLLHMDNFRSAIRGGNINILEYMRAHNCLPHTCSYYYAAVIDRTDIIEWLRDNWYGSEHLSYCGAVYTKNMRLLDWLYDHHYSHSVRSIEHIKDDPFAREWFEEHP